MVLLLEVCIIPQYTFPMKPMVLLLELCIIPQYTFPSNQWFYYWKCALFLSILSLVTNLSIPEVTLTPTQLSFELLSFCSLYVLPLSILLECLRMLFALPDYQVSSSSIVKGITI